MGIYRYWHTCVCLILVVIFSSQANAANTVALVSDVSGNVIIKANGSSFRARLNAKIPLGARIDLPKGTKLSLIYVAKGDKYILSGLGSYQVDASSPKTISGSVTAEQVVFDGALNGKRISSENVTQTAVTLRGGLEEPTPP